MKYWAIAFVMTLTACGSTGGSWRNREYVEQCGYAIDQLGICRR